MTKFRVGVPGELTAKQMEALDGAGITLHGTTRGGREGTLEPMRTYVDAYVDVSAADESEAKAEVARVLDVDPRDLTVQALE
jgi:hypothetical protein